MTHTLSIPLYLPPSLNRLLRSGWRVKHRLKRECRELVAAYAAQQGMPRASGKRRVSLALTLDGRARRLDDDNAWKALLDALVHAGLIVDDSPAWCELGPVTWARGAARGTVVYLEDLEADQSVEVLG